MIKRKGISLNECKIINRCKCLDCLLLYCVVTIYAACIKSKYMVNKNKKAF